MTQLDPRPGTPSDDAVGAEPSVAIAVTAVAPAAAAARRAPERPHGAHRRTSLREMFISFEQRDFRYLGLSTLALGFGQWAQQLGLAWLTLSLTGSAVQLGAISAFRG